MAVWRTPAGVHSDVDQCVPCANRRVMGIETVTEQPRKTSRSENLRRTSVNMTFKRRGCDMPETGMAVNG